MPICLQRQIYLIKKETAILQQKHRYKLKVPLRQVNVLGSHLTVELFPIFILRVALSIASI